MHINRKNDCNMAKNSDKKRSTTEDYFQTVAFDFQSVLQIPSATSSQMYYSRKISVYNLTVCESGNDKHALCNAWNKLNGKRGSSEMGSIPQNFKSCRFFLIDVVSKSALVKNKMFAISKNGTEYNILSI